MIKLYFPAFECGFICIQRSPFEYSIIVADNIVNMRTTFSTCFASAKLRAIYKEKKITVKWQIYLIEIRVSIAQVGLIEIFALILNFIL